MNSKKVLIGLVIVAVLVWGYNFLRISQFSALDAENMNSLTAPNSARLGHVSEFRKPARDPFEPLIPYAKIQTPAQSQISRQGKPGAPAQPVPQAQEPPQVRLNGIMWDPVKPMAILEFPGGNTQMVSPGQIIDGIKIEAVGKQEITLSRDKKKWVVR